MALLNRVYTIASDFLQSLQVLNCIASVTSLNKIVTILLEIHKGVCKK